MPEIDTATYPIDVHHDESIFVNGEMFRIFIHERDIQSRVRLLANQICEEYNEKNPIFVCVLNGAFIFYADLIRCITVPCEVDFLKLSSYGESKISSGNVHLVKDLNCEVTNRHIVIVEDIVDSGASINFIFDWIAKKNPASIKVVTLLHKPESSITNHPLEYVGFEIPSRFVIGYGLDFAQHGRNLPSIYMLPDKNMK